MGKLGHCGYQLYALEEGLLVVSPTQTTLVGKNYMPQETEVALQTAEEENQWIDHKINRSLLTNVD